MRTYPKRAVLCLLILLLFGVNLTTPAGADVTAQDVAEIRIEHGHDQYRHGHGDEGHRWSDYQREARQINRYARAVALNQMATCSREPRCAVRLASFLAGAPYGLVDRIVTCESGYNPAAANPSSSAGGLMQYLESTWEGVAPIYGMAGHSRFEVWPAAWVGANHIARGGPSPWAASQGCWG